MLCISGGWLVGPANAEGSRDMYPSGAPGNRGHISWTNGSAVGVRSRTLLRVFANQGEQILAGSSAAGVGDGDIEIFNAFRVGGSVGNETFPAVADFTCTTEQPGRGFISTRAEELAGPESISGTGNVDGYVPCSFQAPITGVYYVAMYGPSGPESTDSPNPGVEHNIEAINTGTDQATGISAWDVTVRSDDVDSVVDKEGRLHTFFISKNMGQNGVQLYSNLYPVTVDGYRYEIDMRGIDPFGFRIFGSQLGNLDSDGASPLYRDVLGEGSGVNNPVGGTSSAPPQYPIFFNRLDPDILPFLPVYDPFTGLQTGTGFPAFPQLPIVDAPLYTGNVTENTSTVAAGGVFSFNSNITGVFQLVLSRDGVDFDPGNPQNRSIRGYMASAGAQTVNWNGLDNSGDPFPTGSFNFEVQTHAGEYHFPISDAENNFFGGPTYTLLNATNPLGNNTAFYDHRGYRTVGGTDVEDSDLTDGDPYDDALCGSDPPNPPATDLSLGADSSAANFNAFGGTSGGNTNRQCDGGAFGDTKTLDLWTYLPSTIVGNDVVIIDTTMTDYGDAPDTGGGNGSGNYSTLRSDSGPFHGTTTTLLLGSGVTDDTDGFGDGTDANGDGTDDVDDAFTSLASGTIGGLYRLNNIPVVNSTGGNAVLHAWIDFDQDGQFEESEYQTATIADGETAANLSWTIPVSASTGTTFARFRITTDGLVDDGGTGDVDERSLGSASDGEVEDYSLTMQAPAPDGPADVCNAEYGLVYGGDATRIVAIHVDSGSVQELTNGVLAAANGLSADHVNQLVYYGANNNLFAWSPISDTHITITNDFSGFIADPGSRPTSISSGGAAFFNGSVYQGSDIAAGGIFEIYKVDFAPGSNGLTVQAITPIGLAPLVPGTLTQSGSGDDPSWGDFIIEDSGRIIANGNGGQFYWSYDLDTNTFADLSDTFSTNSQLAKDGFGRLWALGNSSEVFQLQVVGNALTEIAGTRNPTTVFTAGDGAECVRGASSIGDFIWNDSDADGVQDTGENGIGNVTVDLIWDLDGDGTIDVGEPVLGSRTTDANGNYDFGDLIFGDYIINVTDTFGTLVGRTLTTSTSSFPVTLAPGAVDFDDADFGYQAPVGNPLVRLVKRITAINRGLENEQSFDNSFIDVGTNSDDDNDTGWPGADTSTTLGPASTVESYLAGITDGNIDNTTVLPGAQLEYTISFLSDGDTTAQDLIICDPIPLNTTFLPDVFNDALPSSTALEPRGIFLSFNGQEVALTNSNDGDELGSTGGLNNGVGGYYFAAGVNPNAAFPDKTLSCGTNTNGVVVVDLSDVPQSTDDGTPINSYGFIRFRVVVD